ncbi:MAG: hypothetical protein M1834_009178 [Cirrosporium novae-zelandiae]|nr:MAG: hypothetical protein M1834_009178 [Cirrosporium novae-zelandiae]
MTRTSDSSYRFSKKMRKGTRSCVECRRRKVRCIFVPGAQICDNCISRKTTCIDQEHASVNAESAQERENNELKTLINQLLQKLDSKGEADSVVESDIIAERALRVLRSELLSSTGTAADILPSIPSPDPFNDSKVAEDHTNSGPLLSLFDVALLSQQRNDHIPDGLLQAESSSHRSLTEKNRRILDALKTLIPTPEDLTLILQASPDC